MPARQQAERADGRRLLDARTGRGSRHAPPQSIRCGAGQLLVASRTVSLAPPTVFWTLPSALSALPSACIFLSPMTLPAASFTAPLACLAAPPIRSLSIGFPPGCAPLHAAASCNGTLLRVAGCHRSRCGPPLPERKHVHRAARQTARRLQIIELAAQPEPTALAHIAFGNSAAVARRAGGDERPAVVEPGAAAEPV